MFGKLSIDVPKLMGYLKLEAYQGNRKVMSRKVDLDFVDLVTKRHNHKRTYSPKSLKDFKDLVKLSDMPIQRHSKKFSLLQQAKMHQKAGEIKYYKTPDELMNRLHVLLGEINAGNKSGNVNNEIYEILDTLLNQNVLTKEQHKQIVDNYLTRN